MQKNIAQIVKKKHVQKNTQTAPHRTARGVEEI